jgi:hypothetical protein
MFIYMQYFDENWFLKIKEEVNDYIFYCLIYIYNVTFIIVYLYAFDIIKMSNSKD